MLWTESPPPLICSIFFHLVPRSIVIALLLFACAGLLPGSPAEQKKIAIYSPSKSYILAVDERNGQDYVALREVLEPMGKVSLKTDGLHWKIRYDKVEGEFTNGSSRARIHGREFALPDRFLLENGRGLIPVSSLSVLLSRFLETSIRYNENSRRLFIGNAGVHFTAQAGNNPANLVIEFSSPVNPTISTEPGKLRMTFTREPLLPPGTPVLTFDNREIPSAAYNESNGAAEIVVNGTVPLLASFSNNGRRITISSAPQTARAAAQNNPQIPASSSSQNPPQPVVPVPSAGAVEAPAISQPQDFAVVDASHGGDERGAVLDANLAEKDVTLALARQLRQAMVARGMATLLVRDGDTTITLDERANVANRTHPAIYICFHASSEGNGVRFYTAMLPFSEDNHGPFLDWETAQSSFLSASQAAADSLATEFQTRKVPVRKLIAPLRPLNNITTPAVAIEVAPPGASVADLNSVAYQQMIAETVATGIANMRNKLGPAQ